MPVIICAPVLRGEDMDEPLRVWPDYWDASVSVVDVNSDPVVVLLSPDTVRGDGIALHKVNKDSRTHAFSVLPQDSSDPSGESGPIDSGGLTICPQDTIADVRMCDDMLCLLNFSSPGNYVHLPVVGGPHWRGLTHCWGIVWDPGIVGIPHLRLCCDCLCLIALCRDVLLFVRGQAYSSSLFQKDIGGWRTIDWELGSLGRVHPSCQAALSFCLDVKQIKGLEMVIRPRWADDILSLQGVSVRGTPVGVIAPVGAAILVIGLSDRVGGSMGRSEWLLLVSRWAWLWCQPISVRGGAVIYPGVFRIGYKGRALLGSSSLDAAPFVGPLDFLCVCYSAVVTVSDLLCSDCFAGELV